MTKNTKYINALITSATDPLNKVQTEAIKKLTKFTHLPRVRKTLLEIVKTYDTDEDDLDQEKRKEALRCLKKVLYEPGVLKAVVNAGKDENLGTTAITLINNGCKKKDKVEAVILAAKENPNLYIRLLALELLGKYNDSKAVKTIVEALKEPYTDTQSRVLTVLKNNLDAMKKHQKIIVDPLREFIAAKTSEVEIPRIECAIDILLRLEPELVEEFSTHEKSHKRYMAAKMLSFIAPKSRKEILQTLLKDKDEGVRYMVVHTLGVLKNRKYAQELLLVAKSDKVKGIRSNASAFLKAIA